ncbi:hypothetical protein R1sor_005991 [Riccia sorocarpa]|uniref:Ubiquitin-like domain-containing protein n=1 Tax=Riccia sorocarpa TaxID=122646 RepID=A0ABD3HL47_9MARC
MVSAIIQSLSLSAPIRLCPPFPLPGCHFICMHPSYKSPSPSPITAMFIRVKRKKTTYFLHCDPSETVLEIKQKLQALSDNPVDCQRLILLSSQLVLEDSKSLADQKVENDAIVALCLRTSGNISPPVELTRTVMTADHTLKYLCGACVMVVELVDSQL